MLHKQARPGENDLATLNPELAAEWHPTKNEAMTPSMVRCNSAHRVWWLGTCGHEWQAPVYSRHQGTGCPYCTHHTLLKGFNDLQTVAPDVAKEWHPTKNGDLAPNMVLAHSKKQAFWRCSHGHEWPMAIYKRTDGIGCPYCNNKQILKGYNDLATTHPELVKEWHPTKNEFGPDAVTAGSQKKAVWLGDCGHEWVTTIGSRTYKKKGCPYCANKKLLKGFNDFATRFPELSKEWHPTKNLPLTPSDILIGMDKVWWLCSDCGHEWSMLPKNRVQAHGCPMCANKRKGKRSKTK